MRIWSIVLAIVSILAFAFGRLSNRRRANVRIPHDSSSTQPGDLGKSAQIAMVAPSVVTQNPLSSSLLHILGMAIIPLVAILTTGFIGKQANGIADIQAELMDRQIAVEQSQALPYFEVTTYVEETTFFDGFAEVLELRNTGGRIRVVNIRLETNFGFLVPGISNNPYRIPDYYYLSEVGSQNQSTWRFRANPSRASELVDRVQSILNNEHGIQAITYGPEVMITITYVDFAGVERTERYKHVCYSNSEPEAPVMCELFVIDEQAASAFSPPELPVLLSYPWEITDNDLQAFVGHLVGENTPYLRLSHEANFPDFQAPEENLEPKPFASPPR